MSHAGLQRVGVLGGDAASPCCERVAALPHAAASN